MKINMPSRRTYVYFIGFLVIIFQAARSQDGTQSCSVTCETPGTNETACNVTTGRCLYGCTDGHTGPRCEYPCAVNCQNCSLATAVDNSLAAEDNNTSNESDTICHGCNANFYLNVSECLPCLNCQSPSGNMTSACDSNGTCLYGCDVGFAGQRCDVKCNDTCLECSLASQDAIATECTQCIENYVLNGSSCLECERCKASSDDDVTRRCDINGTCLHGCDAGYTGVRCDIRCGDSCTNCSIVSSTPVLKTHCHECEMHSYLTNETCTNCTTCIKPDNVTSSCDVNGTCNYGCVDGFLGPRCDIPCSENCVQCVLIKNDTLETNCTRCNHVSYLTEGTCTSCSNCRMSPNNSQPACNGTGVCLFGCVNGKTGSTCAINCTQNCWECDLGSDNTTTCSTCAPGYFRNAGECTECPSICTEDPDGREPKCYEHNGDCRIGCVGNKKYRPKCDKYCSPTCVNGICDITAYCTLGCVNTGVSGDDCRKYCEDGCVSKQCHRSGDCIHGCNPGYYSNTCKPKCSASCTKLPNPSTLHDCNETNGHCHECNSKTIWGPLCENTCPDNCVDGECDRGDGTCTRGCNNEWFGEDCSTPCSPNCFDGTCFQNNGSCTYGCAIGFWQNDCNEKCPEKCQNEACARANGSCTFGCQSKHYGDTCELVCSPYCAGDTCDRGTGRCNGCVEQEYRHGPQCEEKCSVNCKNNTCLQNNGTCVYGCENEWYDAKCDMECEGECIGEMCNRDTGDCDEGCAGGWYGQKCDDTCSPNCLNVTCIFNGTCEFGCSEGFDGSFCNVSLKQPPIDDGLEWWIYAVIGGSTVVILVVILIVVLSNKGRRVKLRKQAGRISRGVSMFFSGRWEPSPLEPGMNPGRTRTPRPGFDFTEMREHEPERVTFDSSRVKVTEILQRVLQMTPDHYAEDFSTLSRGLQKECNAAKMFRNVTKNFYPDILPYDENRVKIVLKNNNPDVVSMIDESVIESDYINASYIMGLTIGKRYIAAQGPSGSTIKDFWRMIWQENTSVIVMMTALPDDGRTRVDKYWPEKDEEVSHGEITIQGQMAAEYADFTQRQFTIIRNGEERTIHHLQLTCWPDHSPPPSSAEMIEFHQKYIAMTSECDDTGPVVVHCTAGVGRTGVFIALDMLVDQGQIEEYIDVIECVRSMREARVNMVQPKSLYEYLYKVTAQSLALDCDLIPRSEIPDKCRELLQTPPTGDTQIDVLFKTCNEAITLDDPDIEEVRPRDERVIRDRPTSDVPEFRYRPTLRSQAYINAVYIDTYRDKNRMLLTQMPTPQTAEDFSNLAIEKQCSTIVMLNEQTNEQDFGMYWPSTSAEPRTLGNIQVSCSDEQTRPTYILRTLNMQWPNQDGGMESHHVTMIQYTAWREVSVLPSVQQMIEFINVVKDTAGNKPLLLHCLNGSEQTGLFCVLYNILEKLEFEDSVSIITTIRKIKTRRPSAIPTAAQFKFCHEVISYYVTAFPQRATSEQ